MPLIQQLQRAFERIEGLCLPLGTSELLVLCQGHFPDRPLIPGAYLLGFMAAFAEGHPVLRVTAGPYWVGLHKGQLVRPVSPGDKLTFRAVGITPVAGRGMGLKVELCVQETCVARSTVVYADTLADPAEPWEAPPPGLKELPAIDLLLPHQPPARLIERLLAFEGTELLTSTAAQEVWVWPAMLEAAAQTGGVLSGLSALTSGRTGLVATYDGIRVYQPVAHGRLTCQARKFRSFANFSQVQVQVLNGDRAVCLDGLCTLAMAP